MKNKKSNKIIGACALCLEEKELTKEHVIPYVLGGRHEWPGLCQECNSKLGSKLDAKFAQNIIVRISRYIHQIEGRSGKLDSIYDEAEGTISEFEIPFRGSKNGQPYIIPKVEVKFLDGGRISVRAGFAPNTSKDEQRKIIIGEAVKEWKRIHPDATKDQLSKVRSVIENDVKDIPSQVTTTDKVMIHAKCDIKAESLFFIRLAYVLAILAHGMDYAQESHTAENLRKSIVNNDTSVPIKGRLLPNSKEIKGIVEAIDGDKYIFAILVGGWAIFSVLGYTAVVQYEANDPRFMFEESEPHLMRFAFDETIRNDEGPFRQGTLKEYLDKNLDRLKMSLAKNDPQMLADFYIMSDQK